MSLLRLRPRDVPTRLSTGAYVLHSGLGKWKGGADQAKGVHGMAAGAFPFLAEIDPPTFLKALAAGEIALGAALLAPFIPNRLAGLGLTGFAGALVAMYLRTPALHKPGSVAHPGRHRREQGRLDARHRAGPAVRGPELKGSALRLGG